MKTANNTIVSWATEKAGETFTAIVTETTSHYNASGAWTHTTTEVIKSVSGWGTRAQAKGSAIKWMRYLAAQMKVVA